MTDNRDIHERILPCGCIYVLDFNTTDPDAEWTPWELCQFHSQHYTGITWEPPHA